MGHGDTSNADVSLENEFNYFMFQSSYHHCRLPIFHIWCKKQTLLAIPTNME